MSVAQCESHFTAANIQLTSAFPYAMSPSSAPSFLPSCWQDLSLSLEKMGESSTALPAQKLFEICSYLCQESLLCFLITANQLLHYHHLSCCFVSHLVETKPTTTGKVQEYTAAMLLQLFGKSVTFPSIQRRIGWEEIQSPGICRKPHDTSFRIHQRCCM